MDAAVRALLGESVGRMAPVTESELGLLAARMQPHPLAPWAHWVQAGSVCTHAGFIAQGCLRYYYLDGSGKEHTGQFFFEGGWVGDFASYYSGQPTNKSFQALEATQLWVVARADLEALYDGYRNWERFGRRMAEHIVVGAQQRAESLLREPLAVRYARLVRERPKVVARVPQHVIASYLGVKPESLSRLRGRLAKAGN